MEALSINSINAGYENRDIELSGWIDSIRDHGGVMFADLRNRSGKIQLVFDSSGKDSGCGGDAAALRAEFVVRVRGSVARRPEDSVNKKIPTGEVELKVSSFEILNGALPLPFYPGEKVGDEAALKYRFLDLRSPDMMRNLEAVDRLMRITREYFSQLGFWDVPTPMLTKSTPEGARDYLVPSRTKPGSFFALPQSPQLFKQLLMASGVERYYQITRCFRDEDLRSDRQPEFTQIDMEMSFAASSDIMETVWNLVEKIFTAFEHKLPPAVLMKYEEAMASYGSDKPDMSLDTGLLADITEIFRKSEFKVFSSSVEKGNKIAAFLCRGDFSRKELDDAVEDAKKLGAGGLVWIKKGGEELKCPVAKLFSDDEKNALKEKFPGDGVIFAGSTGDSFALMGELRKILALRRGLKKEGFFPVWVVEAPLFEKNSEGRLQAVHHPFTAPIGDIFSDEAASLKSHSYDLVINGEEIGGGSIRIHKAREQIRVFELMGISGNEYREKFGFLLDALSYGCPPHGGFAFGMERLAVKLLGLDSIKDVIAFPKTQNAFCPLTHAPDVVSKRQLRELGLKTADE
ncbi:MAG: aspartate--tRNA ligase [Elusimicrobia bacterium CG_4_10_14_3_um_filter_49_12_50_7]|nr:MAG: aspartate--tRNA ligase [Elusimicrobia bacterium CG03_land_8_20_14_0_80_50_18]PIX13802.1 MAG: aspartate--tRNA ligase [Elusimicrobia bacterium CG_4_8_14_3_um_filter_50_9]PIY16501.1 MAG: aspartate--tRNA ligase [Elusimicrobia bacterium CG_4_10_14_3_um_filter_49_12_50_7]